MDIFDLNVDVEEVLKSLTKFFNLESSRCILGNVHSIDSDVRSRGRQG